MYVQSYLELALAPLQVVYRAMPGHTPPAKFQIDSFCVLQGMLTHVLVSMGSSSALVLLYAVLLVLRPQPWYRAQQLLPVLAMLLSNAISAISRGLASALEELTDGRERVEMLLAIGASRMEATHAVVQRALAAALSPLLQQMSVVGLVSLPSFMSGQLIAGGAAPQVRCTLCAVTRQCTSVGLPGLFRVLFYSIATSCLRRKDTTILLLCMCWPLSVH